MASLRRVGTWALLAGVLAASTAHAGPKRKGKARAVAATAATAALLAIPTTSSALEPTPDTPSPSTSTSTRTSPSTSTRTNPSTSTSTLTTASPALQRHVRKDKQIAPGADPSLLTIETGPDAGHYLVTTGMLSVRRSDDLVHWRKAGTLFKGNRLPRDVAGDFWAPSLSTDGKRFFLRYSARGHDGILRVRSAVARKVTGPYRDLGPTVPHDAGTSVGDIDASELIDVDGSRWLLWKHDGNAAGQRTPIYIQRLGPRGEHLIGPRRQIALNDQAWEGIDTEAPSAIRRGRYIYVSYAGYMYGTSRYNVGMLRIDAPHGLAAALRGGARFVKHRGPVARSTSANHVGMAHGDFILGGDYFISHGWRRGEVRQSPRVTLVRKVTWKRGWPAIRNGAARRGARGR
ncbi:MAG TPA: family 43 glycosylhydrolase [Kofleriaceae bacterium]|nr:family 43 glycosylhydrolase [Kofleriaceae bacterium]